jgi:hypothetical protein
MSLGEMIYEGSGITGFQGGNPVTTGVAKKKKQYAPEQQTDDAFAAIRTNPKTVTTEQPVSTSQTTGQPSGSVLGSGDIKWQDFLGKIFSGDNKTPVLDAFKNLPGDGTYAWLIPVLAAAGFFGKRFLQNNGLEKTAEGFSGVGSDIADFWSKIRDVLPGTSFQKSWEKSGFDTSPGGAWSDENNRLRNEWDKTISEISPNYYGTSLDSKLQEWNQYGPEGYKYAPLVGGINKFQQAGGYNQQPVGVAATRMPNPYGYTTGGIDAYLEQNPTGWTAPFSTTSPTQGTNYNPSTPGGGDIGRVTANPPTGSGPGIDRPKTPIGGGGVMTSTPWSNPATAVPGGSPTSPTGFRPGDSPPGYIVDNRWQNGGNNKTAVQQVLERLGIGNGQVINRIKTGINSLIPQAAEGGTTTGEGLVYVHPNETIVPEDKTKQQAAQNTINPANPAVSGVTAAITTPVPNMNTTAPANTGRVAPRTSARTATVNPTQWMADYKPAQTTPPAPAGIDAVVGIPATPAPAAGQQNVMLAPGQTNPNAGTLDYLQTIASGGMAPYLSQNLGGFTTALNTNIGQDPLTQIAQAQGIDALAGSTLQYDDKGNLITTNSPTATYLKAQSDLMDINQQKSREKLAESLGANDKLWGSEQYQTMSQFEKEALAEKNALLTQVMQGDVNAARNLVNTNLGVQQNVSQLAAQLAQMSGTSSITALNAINDYVAKGMSTSTQQSQLKLQQDEEQLKAVMEELKGKMTETQWNYEFFEKYRDMMQDNYSDRTKMMLSAIMSIYNSFMGTEDNSMKYALAMMGY